MYDKNDLDAARQAAKKALLLMLLPAIPLLGATVFSFVIRDKWLTILLSSLTGCWIIFIYQMVYVPKKAYREHIQSAMGSSQKECDGHYLRMENTPVERNNVMFYAFYLNVGEKQDPEDDRLFYYDAQKPIPDWKSGDMLHIVSYDKFVSAYNTLSGAEQPAPAV